MTVKELIKKLNAIENKNAFIHIGCQGYTTIDDPTDEYEIRLYDINDGILIADNGYYENYK